MSPLTKKKSFAKPSAKRIEGVSLESFDRSDASDKEDYQHCGLIFGRPGIGKSTFLSTYPDVLLLSTERITAGLRCKDYQWRMGGVTSWSIFLEAVEMLCSRGGQDIKVVGIDTFDALHEQCARHICQELNITHASDDSYGRAWSFIKMEFSSQIRKLLASGKGVVFTSHAKEREITTASGSKFVRIQPSCSESGYSILKALTDYAFYADFMRSIKHDRTLRVLITEGDEIVDAKHSTAWNTIPRFCLMNSFDDVMKQREEGQRKSILTIDDLIPSNATTTGTREYLKKTRMEKRRK